MREMPGRGRHRRRSDAGRKRGLPQAVAGVGVAIGTLAAPAPDARADFKVDAPSIEAGVLTLEHSSSYAHDRSPKRDREISLKQGVAYGVTSWWESEFDGEVARDPGDGERSRFRFLRWKNTFRFTGEDAWLAAGGIVEYARDLRSGRPDAVQTGLLLQKEFAPVTLTLNLLMTREFGPQASVPLGLGYSFQAKHEFTPALSVALEAYGASEPIESFNLFHEHDHRIGPVLLGEIALGHARLRYELGYLAGVGGGSPDGTVKWLVGLDVPF